MHGADCALADSDVLAIENTPHCHQVPTVSKFHDWHGFHLTLSARWRRWLFYNQYTQPRGLCLAGNEDCEAPQLDSRGIFYGRVPWSGTLNRPAVAGLVHG